MALVEVRNVHKSFQRDSQVIEVFENLTLDVAAGGFTALMGPSGSGKSTFLNLLAGLDRPTSGTITVAGALVSTLSPSALAKWRGPAHRGGPRGRERERQPPQTPHQTLFYC